MGCLLSLSNPLRQFFFPLVFFVFFSPVNGKDNLTPPSFTPINGDLYHSSGLLMEEISNLVHRHPDKFTMETIETGNQGYKAEVTVVTYCRNRKEIDDRSKFRILLMIPCLPEFWAAWEGAHYI